MYCLHHDVLCSHGQVGQWITGNERGAQSQPVRFQLRVLVWTVGIERQQLCSGLQLCMTCLQAPPKPAKVKIEGYQAVSLTKTVTAMRGICNERLKIDVEYGLKMGTTDNSYLIKVGSQRSASAPDLDFLTDSGITKTVLCRAESSGKDLRLRAVIDDMLWTGRHCTKFYYCLQPCQLLSWEH